MCRLPSPLHIDVERIADAQGELLVEERILLNGATAVRQRELIAGRVLGHRLMARAGYGVGPIKQNAQGAPLWPNGLCGSIAHTSDTVVVAMAPVSSVHSLGVDIEDGRDLGEAMSNVVDDDEIRAVLNYGLASDAAAAGRLLFSAKEALFKCQAPLTGNIDLAFDQIRLDVHPNGHLYGVPYPCVDYPTAGVMSRILVVLKQLQWVTTAIAWLE